MHTDTDAALGLRERKKRRTRRLIAEAGLELFDRQGFEGTTISQIAAAADVSPRTVSHYFPAKEEIAFPSEAQQFESLRARLLERPEDETTLDALRAWVEAHAPHWRETKAETRVQRRVIEASEALRAHEARSHARLQEVIAESIASDLDCATDDVQPRMAAAATVAILRTLGEEAARGTGAAASEEDALALVDQAVRFVAGGIRALPEPAAERRG